MLKVATHRSLLITVINRPWEILLQLPHWNLCAVLQVCHQPVDTVEPMTHKSAALLVHYNATHHTTNSILVSNYSQHM